MFSLRRVALVALTGMALAGCGGSMSSVTPGTGAQGTQAGPRAPQTGIQVASPEIYVAYNGVVNVYDLSAGNGASPKRTIPVGNNDIIQGIATSPSGNLGILKNYFVGNNEYCTTLIYPPGADANTPAPAGHLCDPQGSTTQAESMARGLNGGYDVLYRTAYNGIGNSSFAVEHLDSSGTITSTLPLPTGGAGWGSIATNSAGKDFVGEVGHVLKYDPAETNPANSQRTFTLPSGYYPWAIAVAGSSTLYIAAGHTGTLAGEVIYAYPPGATSPARTIGPFPNWYIISMATDSQGLLYVGVSPVAGSPGKARVRVYAADANGNASPLRALIDPNNPYGDIKGIAIYQP